MINDKPTNEEIKQLWGDDLYNVFSAHIDEYGRLTSDWATIIESEIPKYDKDYNTNPLHVETYSRMYLLDFDTLEDGKYIRP